MGTIEGGPNDLTLYDVTSDIATASVPVLYTDVATGTVLGTITGLNTNGATVEITLNADGLAAVNAARGDAISIGLTASPLNPPSDAVFLFSSPLTLRQLVLADGPSTPAPVPTMTEWMMILFGTMLAGGAAIYLQRRRMMV